MTHQKTRRKVLDAMGTYHSTQRCTKCGAIVDDATYGGFSPDGLYCCIKCFNELLNN